MFDEVICLVFNINGIEIDVGCYWGDLRVYL